MIRDRQPTVREIIAELDNPTADIGFCKHVQDGQFKRWVEPSEIYIEALGAWLRCDGISAGFALNGTRHFARDSRRAIANAVQRWINRRAHQLDRLESHLEAFGRQIANNIDGDQVGRALQTRMCCDGHDCGCQGSTIGQFLAWQLGEVRKRA